MEKTHGKSGKEIDISWIVRLSIGIPGDEDISSICSISDDFPLYSLFMLLSILAILANIMEKHGIYGGYGGLLRWKIPWLSQFVF